MKNTETNISKRFTYTAINKSGNIISNDFSRGNAEMWFYKSMAELLICGYKIIYAACIHYNEEDQWSQVTVLKTYMSE